MRARSAQDLVVFLGPSLPAAAARALAPCRILPPARAGDVYALLPERPRAIALVDGVFDTVPSVWHHELLAALDAGVALFGGASMGALRAAELSRHGMVGVGRIFADYRDGRRIDDADVALLHATAAHGWRALTVPLVDADRAVEEAVRRGLLTVRAARQLSRAARGCFYQERTWERLLQEAGLGTAITARLRAWLPGAPSQKAEDAAATIVAAGNFLRGASRAVAAGGRTASRAGRADPRAAPTQARRLELDAAGSNLGGEPIPGRKVLAALAARPDAGRLAADGLRHALLAGWARGLGLPVTEAECRRAEAAWLASLGVPRSRRAAFLAASGLDEAGARRLARSLALEAAALEWAARLQPDGPGWTEGLALGARLAGAWPVSASASAAARGSDSLDGRTAPEKNPRPLRSGSDRRRTTWPRRRRKPGRSGWR